jgi:hypothetical protein
MMKILKVVLLTKIKTKMSDDKMPFNAPFSSKTLLNLKNLATSNFSWQYTNLDFQCQRDVKYIYAVAER